MRKSIKAVVTAAIAGAALVALVGCGGGAAAGSSSAAADAGADKVIKVGASPAPHAELLGLVADDLAADGWTLEVIEFNDYIQPNVALNDGELDANYFQHIAYLDDYNAENKTTLVSAGAIHFEPLGIYPGKATSLADAKTIAVPSDPTNEARALLLLQDQGLIKLKDGAGLTATKNDIAENPNGIEIIETEAASIPRTLEDVDLGVINGNYAISAGIDVATALAQEDAKSAAAEKYANIIAVRGGDENSEKAKALVAALSTPKVKEFIDATYAGAVITVF